MTTKADNGTARRNDWTAVAGPVVRIDGPAVFIEARFMSMNWQAAPPPPARQVDPAALVAEVRGSLEADPGYRRFAHELCALTMRPPAGPTASAETIARAAEALLLGDRPAPVAQPAPVPVPAGAR